ncbi:MAG: hypothetical protein EAZ42_05220 [Verrucomicrobia bacterium]|nr:MAG: hypothetical protein EAZ42_05220 [Verrucomicrobiota bacterium]
MEKFDWFVRSCLHCYLLRKFAYATLIMRC